MTLWLTLLLVWAVGIPVAVLLATATAAHTYQRRRARCAPLVDRWHAALPRRCERRRRPRGLGALHARRPV
jgi:hypothetical protein